MQTLLQDIRYAFRMIAKQPGFAALAVLAFALGIGANVAIFSVVNAVLLRPLPYPQSDRLISIRERTPTFPGGSVSYPNFLDWRASQKSFTDLALFRRESYNLSSVKGGTAPERIGGARVTANFFTVLGVPPPLGRDFTEADDVPHGPKVALISDKMWRKRFGASREVLGQHLLVDGVSHEIIGVLSPVVRLPRLAELYVPLGDVRTEPGVLLRDNHPGFGTLGRLKPGVSLEQAHADLDTIAVALEKKYPESNTGRRVTTQLLLESSVGTYRQSLYLLLGAVACVLLIACANVANLQLARMLARGKELAVRSALGASGWRLTRQVLTESAVLALLGALAGVLLAIWSLDAILALSPASVPRFQETRIDLAALIFSVVVAVLAGVLVGIWPAWRISKSSSLALALHESARGSSDGVHKQRARNGLVVTQVALAVVLLAAGGLMLKSFWRAQQAPLGFDPRNILTMSVALPSARYDTPEKINAFYDRLVAKVSTLPSVTAAATGVNIPFDDNEWDSSFHITGTPPNVRGQEPSAEMNYISPDYFKVLGMPVLRGRAFGPEDGGGKQTSVMIDETLATRFFPGQDPIGKQLDNNQTLKPNPPPLTIVGIVPRTRNEAPGEENVESLNFPQIYLPAAQFPNENVTLTVRVAAGDPLALAPAVKREIEAIDPDQPVAQVSTMEKNIGASLAARRLTMTLLGAFAGLALVLASVGIYGVMALSTTQRTREMGIRFALGASRADVLKLVLGKGISLIGVGLGAGLVGAFAASRALNSMLYGVGALDAAALIGAIVTLAAVAFIACYLPARRASMVNPIEALRTE
ncbi:MAG TPA: ABC transporter permease [Chthoniobacterales bacterium]|nr:ABC transporter permease [Chthoniobacterales bacterium]